MEVASVQTSPKTLSESYESGEVEDFSLVLGGPLFQLLRKSHLEGDSLELLYRRIFAFIFLTWFPLLVLTFGTGVGRVARISFFGDIEARTEQKWVRGASPSEELLGTGDIQSLADLGNSYEILRGMRVVPFGLQDVSRLAFATAAPISPLLLTIFSFEELIIRVFKIVF